MRNVIGHEASLLYNITGAKGLKLAFNECLQLNKVIRTLERMLRRFVVAWLIGSMSIQVWDGDAGRWMTSPWATWRSFWGYASTSGRITRKSHSQYALRPSRVIVDGMECPIKKPKEPVGQQATFSTYKNINIYITSIIIYTVHEGKLQGMGVSRCCDGWILAAQSVTN